MKSPSIVIISVAVLGLLAITNPKMADYEQFIHTQITKDSEKADGLGKGMMLLFGGFASSLITNATSRDDYIFISTFDTKLGDDHIKTIGVLNNFIVLSHHNFGSSNEELLPTKNNEQLTPCTPTKIMKSSHIAFIPATSNIWSPIQVDTFGWQYPRNVVQKTEQQRFTELLGKDYIAFVEFIGVADWVERHGQFIVGTGCMSHSCDNKHGIFVIDTTTGHPYAAIIDNDRVTTWGASKKQDLPYLITEWLSENELKVE